MKTTRLFPKERVSKFFDILSRLSGVVPIDQSHYPWKHYQTIYTEESNHVPCTREVFVHRTVAKWLKGKYVILYKTSDLGAEYKQYLYLSSISYQNNWGSGYIKVWNLDYSKLHDVFIDMNVDRGDALYLEGEWCDNADLHLLTASMFSMDSVPEKEYVFRAYDFSKYPKRSKKGVDPLDSIKTTVSVLSKTESGAHKKVKQLGTSISIAEIIDVK